MSRRVGVTGPDASRLPQIRHIGTLLFPVAATAIVAACHPPIRWTLPSAPDRAQMTQLWMEPERLTGGQRQDALRAGGSGDEVTARFVRRLKHKVAEGLALEG